MSTGNTSLPGAFLVSVFSALFFPTARHRDNQTERDKMTIIFSPFLTLTEYRTLFNKERFQFSTFLHESMSPCAGFWTMPGA